MQRGEGGEGGEGHQGKKRSTHTDIGPWSRFHTNVNVVANLMSTASFCIDTGLNQTTHR